MTMRPCTICGGEAFAARDILWPELIAEWELAPEEAAYINRQQGTSCTQCGANLRQIALGKAVLGAMGAKAPLVDAVQAGPGLAMLDINGAETISRVLSKLTGYTRVDYPDVDMQAMPYADAVFDLVLHSDTLEHVPDPGKALSECLRVLRPGGHLCFTIPVVVGRMSRNRAGLAPSYHGNPQMSRDDFIVHTEFGADAWTYLARAGFSDIRVHTVEYPAALAWTGRRMD